MIIIIIVFFVAGGGGPKHLLLHLLHPRRLLQGTRIAVSLFQSRSNPGFSRLLVTRPQYMVPFRVLVTLNPRTLNPTPKTFISGPRKYEYQRSGFRAKSPGFSLRRGTISTPSSPCKSQPGNPQKAPPCIRLNPKPHTPKTLNPNPKSPEP